MDWKGGKDVIMRNAAYYLALCNLGLKLEAENKESASQQWILTSTLFQPSTGNFDMAGRSIPRGWLYCPACVDGCLYE